MLKDMLRYRADARQVGAILVAAFLVLLGVAYMINRSYTLQFWDRGYELKADFVDADGIANASDVRIHGVYVGQVTGVQPKPGGLAEITFRINKEDAPLPQGTRVNLRLQTLLGQKFLDLVPGPLGAPEIPTGSVIPAASTQSPVDFDQLLSTFDKPTRDAVATIIQEGGAATAGRGEDVNALLGDLNSLSVNSTPDLETFSDRGQNLGAILTNLASVGDDLAQNRQHLANVETQLNDVLGTLAQHDAGFRGFIQNGDASLGHGLAQYGGEARNIQASLDQLRPLVDRLDPLLVQVDYDTHLMDPITTLQKSLTPYIASSVGGYNANPNCPSGSANGGCGGNYLRQFVIFATSPTNAEVGSPYPVPGAATHAAAGGSAAGGRQPGSGGQSGAPSGLPGLPGLPGGIPGLTAPSPGGTGALSSGFLTGGEQDSVSAELLAYLLGS
jgi:virulence factor Mce-like protein